jgi:hypothetical protein
MKFDLRMLEEGTRLLPTGYVRGRFLQEDITLLPTSARLTEGVAGSIVPTAVYIATRVDGATSLQAICISGRMTKDSLRALYTARENIVHVSYNISLSVVADTLQQFNDDPYREDFHGFLLQGGPAVAWLSGETWYGDFEGGVEGIELPYVKVKYPKCVVAPQPKLSKVALNKAIKSLKRLLVDLEELGNV